MITATRLGKRYGAKVAVTFGVRPGMVTGFLGPNGAGKSTTMRLMLDLDRGSGETLFDGRRFDTIRHPMREIGAVLEARAFHPTRSARNHLRMLAAGSGIPAGSDRRPRVRRRGPAARADHDDRVAGGGVHDRDRRRRGIRRAGTGRCGVRDALRFEWVRLRTLRSTYWLIGSALVLNVAIALLTAYLRHEEPPRNVVVAAVTGGGANAPLPMAVVLLAVLGVFTSGHEYRYGTIQPTLTTVPQRVRLFTAKVLVVGATALVVTAVSVVLNVAATLPFWPEVPSLTDVTAAGYLLLAVLWAMLGVALGQLLRGVPGALVVILVTPMIVEQLIFRLSYAPALDWLTPAVKFLPFTAGLQLVSAAGEASGGTADEVGLLSRWLSGAVFAVFVAIALVAAGTLFRRRDA
jgi:ABC-2 type transport system permease protein